MATDATILEQFVLSREISPWGRFRRSLWSFIRHKPLGSICALIVIALIAMALFPGAFSRGVNPDVGVLSDRLHGPSTSHWMGTDQNGRDMWARIMYGARTSIIIGFGVVAVATILATILGILSGYFSGWIDTVVQRIAVGSSRIIRGAAIAAKENQYVEAARVLGASDMRIVFRHVLPNVVAIIIVSASIQIGAAILIESALAFLGYGVQPPVASWGRMLNDAQLQIQNHFYLAVFPGLAIFLTVYSFNMLGD